MKKDIVTTCLLSVIAISTGFSQLAGTNYEDKEKNTENILNAEQYLLLQEPDEEMQANATGVHIGAKAMPFVRNLGMGTTDGSVMGMPANMAYGIGFSYFFNNMIAGHIEMNATTFRQRFSNPRLPRPVMLRYVTVPVLFSLNTNYADFINFNVTAGPQLGMRSVADMRGTRVNGEITPPRNAIFIAQPADISIAYGAGVDMALGPDNRFHINSGFRLTNGLVNIPRSDFGRIGNANVMVIDMSRLNTFGVFLGVSYQLTTGTLFKEVKEEL